MEPRKAKVMRGRQRSTTPPRPATKSSPDADVTTSGGMDKLLTQAANAAGDDATIRNWFLSLRDNGENGSGVIKRKT